MNKYDLIKGTINIGDDLIHILAQRCFRVVKTGRKQIELVDENNNHFTYYRDVLRQCFIRKPKPISIPSNEELKSILCEALVKIKRNLKK